MEGRLLTLDAMRGVAAIVVVYYHSAIITDAACFDPTCNVRFGFLAVDMFFALSGFVLSHSYDRSFDNGLSPWAFMKKRLVRLMPIYWLGLLVALPIAVLEVAKGGQTIDGLLGTTAFNAIVLPFPGAATQVTVVSLLRPAWSLFFELWVANLLFALFWRQLRGAGLAAVIVASMAALVVATLHHGSLDVGPVWHTFLGGFPRVLFSFFLGVALRRWAVRLPALRLPSPVLLVATVATFFVPVARGWEPVFELACVALVYPVLIYAGAGATETRPRLAKLLGDASYALYLIHMPLLDMLEKSMRRVGIAPNQAAAALFVIVAVVCAVLIDAVYDRRARRLLDRLLAPRRGAAPTGPAVPAEVAHAPAWSMQPAVVGHGGRI